MGIYISGVKGLPEQVQENKEKIKTIEEEIEGIDFDAIHNLENQVAENTQDIDDIQQAQGVQDTAINTVANRTQYMVATASGTIFNEDVYMQRDLEVSQDIKFETATNGNILLNNQDNGHNKIASKQYPSAYIDFDSDNYFHIMSDGGEYEFSNDQIKINGTPIGGGTSLYQHNIKIYSANACITCQIINDNNTPFTSWSALTTYLDSKGFNDTNNVLVATGLDSSISVIGLMFNNNTLYCLRATNASNMISGATFYDKVIAL